MQKIGKFEVIQPLGRGGQSTVLLAHDPDLDRKVAIKLLNLQGERAERRCELLQEARAVGALRHPAIVTVFEAGEHVGSPYLVFEYVEGQTLAQQIKREGSIAPECAATILLDALDGLAHAHDAGIVHRDFKPSNILVTASGKARVTDFGVAVRIGAGGNGGAGLSGTPRYMAPEYVANGEIGPQNDVFAAGLVLFEMLFGEAAITGDDVLQILHRIVNEPLLLPADAARRAGGPLLDVFAKATAKDPFLRYASARDMQHAIRQYLQPDTEASDLSSSGSSTLDFLLRRMRHKSDFPAMSASVATINQFAASDRSNATTLSGAILKDLALTNKVLRISNSAYYARNGGGRISTVSRAIVILGFETVRQLAISLTLFEHIEDKKHSQQLKDEFLRASLRGLLAKSLSKTVVPKAEEQAFICGLFHGLGRLLVQFYFQEEAAMISRLTISESCSEETAARRVLGIGLEDLGIGVAKTWCFPESLVNSMRAPPKAAVLDDLGEAEPLRGLAGLADEWAALLESTGADQRAATSTALLRRYAKILPLTAAEFGQLTSEAIEGLRDLARVLQIQPKNPALAALIPKKTALETAALSMTATAEFSLPIAAREQSAQAMETAEVPKPESILSGGIQDISQWLVDDSMKAEDILAAIAEIIYRALSARRVLVCVRDGSARMVARYGVGEQIDGVKKQFRFSCTGSDLFSLILSKDVDVLVSDASAEKIRKHLPEWFREHVDAPSFLVLPLRSQGVPVAMIYAESRVVNGLRPSAEALNLLRTLRNQALLVVRQKR